MQNHSVPIKQKGYREKAGIDKKFFSEYILIENIRALYRCPAVVSSILIENHKTLKHILGLELSPPMMHTGGTIENVKHSKET